MNENEETKQFHLGDFGEYGSGPMSLLSEARAYQEAMACSGAKAWIERADWIKEDDWIGATS